MTLYIPAITGRSLPNLPLFQPSPFQPGQLCLSSPGPNLKPSSSPLLVSQPTPNLSVSPQALPPKSIQMGPFLPPWSTPSFRWDHLTWSLTWRLHRPRQGCSPRSRQWAHLRTEINSARPLPNTLPGFLCHSEVTPSLARGLHTLFYQRGRRPGLPLCHLSSHLLNTLAPLLHTGFGPCNREHPFPHLCVVD